MNVDILHTGFDGLKVNVDGQISVKVRQALATAKESALEFKSPVPARIGDMDFLVRHSGNHAFSIHTGEYGAEFHLHDPEFGQDVDAGIKVDFRAFFLATEGLEGARAYFFKAMDALQVRFNPDQMRVSRVDFAVDFLAPWFIPDVESVLLPSRMGKREFSEKDSSERFFANTEVTGITCGQVGNRQLVIYDKRAEVIGKRKMGWLKIWNHNLSSAGRTPIDLKERDQSRVWRVENRVGAKCLRRRWEIKGWADLDAMIGDVFNESLNTTRYLIPQNDRNRSRWPEHELWTALRDVYDSDFASYRSGVLPNDVKEVNRAEHERMIDQNILGNLITRAVSSGVKAEGFWKFSAAHLKALERMSEDHPMPLEQRIAKAEGRYRFR